MNMKQTVTSQMSENYVWHQWLQT